MPSKCNHKLVSIAMWAFMSVINITFTISKVIWKDTTTRPASVALRNKLKVQTRSFAICHKYPFFQLEQGVLDHINLFYGCIWFDT